MQTKIDNNIIALAHKMADAAGEILRQAYRKPITVDQKSDASPVTLADREVEAAMRALIESHYPEHGIIGEEYGNVRENSPYQWVLDPIDGTRSFIAGYPLFTTLIALAYEGVPLLGLIDQPILKERWIGVSGVNTALATNTKTMLSQALLNTTSTDYFTAEQANLFKNLKAKCANTALGGDAYAYAMLANGRIDIIVDGGMKPYDFCALKPVIESMGGVITDWTGKPLTTMSDGSVLAAANSDLHKSALAFLRV